MEAAGTAIRFVEIEGKRLYSLHDVCADVGIAPCDAFTVVDRRVLKRGRLRHAMVYADLPKTVMERTAVIGAEDVAFLRRTMKTAPMLKLQRFTEEYNRRLEKLNEEFLREVRHE